jgi:hypothetical protein
MGSGSSGSGREKPRSKHKKKVARTKIGMFVKRRGINQVDLLPLEISLDQVYPGTRIYFSRYSVP